MGDNAVESARVANAERETELEPTPTASINATTHHGAMR